MTWRAWLGLMVLTAIVAYGAGRFTAPAKVVTQTVRVDVARIREVTTGQASTSTTTATRQSGIFKGTRKTLPDGSVTEEGTWVWGEELRQTTHRRLSFQVDRLELQEHREEAKKTVQNEQPRLNLFGGAGLSTTLQPEVLVGGQYRLWGPISVGAWLLLEYPLPKAGGLLVSVTL